MIEFLEALRDPTRVALYGLLVGLLASVSLGTMGSFVVVRRISYIAGAISHSVLGGIGLALYLQTQAGIAWFPPMVGAVAAALASALVIGAVSLRGDQREDTVIGAIWASGMALGLLFMFKAAAYADAMSYLFGSITLVGPRDIVLVVVLDLVVLGLVFALYPRLVAVCFDEEFARTRGVRVELYYMLLLCLTALTVVLLVRVVGIVMVIALLTLPAAIAGYFSRKLWQMMVLASAFCMVFVFVGMAAALTVGPQGLPTGPCIILTAGAVYLLVVGVRALLPKPKRRLDGE
jgi:zinc transport system permease protein